MQSYPSNLLRLVILQKKIIRIICNTEYNAHTNPLFTDLSLLKFHNIQKLQICQFMFSLRTNLLPGKFTDFCIYNYQLHNYNTRSKSLFHLPKAKTNIRQFSFRYLGPTFYNSLPDQVKNSKSYATFTKHAKSYFIEKYKKSPGL